MDIDHALDERNLPPVADAPHNSAPNPDITPLRCDTSWNP